MAENKKFIFKGDVVVENNINVAEDVVVEGDLTVKGVTHTEDHETIIVKDNMLVLNSDKEDLKTAVSGIAMNKNEASTYAVVYDPNDDTVKFGEGSVDENNEFSFNENEGLPLAVRDDSTAFTDGHIVQWDSDGNKFIDSGVNLDSSTNTIDANISGNASTANEFKSNQTIELNGDVTGSASSKAGWKLENTTLANTGVTANSYGPKSSDTASLGNGGKFKVPYFTVDAKGRLTQSATKEFSLPSYVAGNGLSLDSEGKTFAVNTGDGLEISNDNVKLKALHNTNKTYGPTTDVTGTDAETIKVPEITVDIYGRVTNVSERTYTSVDTNTHYTTRLKVGASDTATTNAEATNGNVYLNVLDDANVRDSHNIVGSGATTVTSDANGKITVGLNVGTGLNVGDDSILKLKAASTTELGGVKSAGDVTITDGVISVNNNSHDHDATTFTGVLPRNKGGTGETSLDAFIKLFMNLYTTTTYSSINTNRIEKGADSGEAVLYFYISNINGLLVHFDDFALSGGYTGDYSTKPNISVSTTTLSNGSVASNLTISLVIKGNADDLKDMNITASFKIAYLKYS